MARPKIGPCYISKKLNSYLVNTCIINDQQALFFMSLVLRNVLVERSFKRAALKTCVRSNVVLDRLFTNTTSVQSAIISVRFIR